MCLSCAVNLLIAYNVLLEYTCSMGGALRSYSYFVLSLSFHVCAPSERLDVIGISALQ